MPPRRYGCAIPPLASLALCSVGRGWRRPLCPNRGLRGAHSVRVCCTCARERLALGRARAALLFAPLREHRCRLVILTHSAGMLVTSKTGSPTLTQTLRDDDFFSRTHPLDSLGLVRMLRAQQRSSCHACWYGRLPALPLMDAILRCPVLLFLCPPLPTIIFRSRSVSPPCLAANLMHLRRGRAQLHKGGEVVVVQTRAQLQSSNQQPFPSRSSGAQKRRRLALVQRQPPHLRPRCCPTSSPGRHFQKEEEARWPGSTPQPYVSKPS